MSLSLDLCDVPLYLNSSYAFGKEYQRYILCNVNFDLC